jgi:hypothetical protein
LARRRGHRTQFSIAAQHSQCRTRSAKGISLRRQRTLTRSVNSPAACWDASNPAQSAHRSGRLCSSQPLDGLRGRQNRSRSCGRSTALNRHHVGKPLRT